MLIIHDPGEAPGPLAAARGRWPGPHVLSLVGGHRRPPGWVAAAARDFLVLDHAVAPASRLEALRVAVLRLARLSGSPLRPAAAGPAERLMFSHGTPSPGALAWSRHRLWRRPHAIDAALGADGGLDRLVLGPGIVTGPLFATFFETMTAGLAETETDAALAVMRRHLVPA